MPLTYSKYLRVKDLISLQTPLSDGPEHDETLFIVVHQVYELWFKQILHELRYLRILLAKDDLPRAGKTLKRVLTILKTLVAQVDVLETMTPLSFSAFRSRLETASGFQSVQFRQLEILLGRRDRRFIENLPLAEEEIEALKKQMKEPSLFDSLLGALKTRRYPVPQALLERAPDLPLPESDELQNILIDIYRSDTELSQLCERFMDLDEGLQEWRYRHVKMVERTIGTKPGTGGSAGAEYLKKSLFKPLFPDLWAIRNRL